MDLDEALSDALRDAKRAFAASASGRADWRAAVDAWRGFYAAVDWHEGWLRALLATHACLFVAIVVTRKNERAQGLMFCACAAIVFAAERINAWGGARWETFATQNYFDRRGLFITVVLSTPLVVATLIILVNLLFIMTGMMVEVARRRKETGVKKTQ